MRRNLFLIGILLLSGIILANPCTEVKKLSEEGKIKEAIEKYKDCYLTDGKHDAGLLEEIFYGFLRNTDPKYGYATRRDTGEILVNEVITGKREKEEVISLLKENLKFPDTGVKVNAAKFLILLGYREKELLPALKEGLYKGDAAVSMDAALLLPSIKEDESLVLLKEAMGSKNPLVAISAVKGLEGIGGEEAKRLLIKGLKYGGGRSKAGETSLRGIPFSGFMSFYTPGQVRIACAKALGKFSGDEVVKALGEALKSSDKNLKLYALKSLGEIAKRSKDSEKKRWWRRKRSALFYIKSALKDGELKDTAYGILASLKKDEGIKYFREKLKVGNWDEKIKALSILAKIKDEIAFKYLSDALSSAQPDVRRKAIYLLQFYGEKSLSLLDKASKDPDWKVRLGVVNVAGTIGEKGERILRQLTEDKDTWVRKEAIFSLTGLSLSGNWGIDFLLEEGFFGLKFSRRELAQLKNKKEVIDSIKKWIEKADKYTKVELAEVLLGLGEKDVSIPILRKVLSWNHAPRYQKKAAYALATIGDISALPFLQKRFFDYGYMETGTLKALLDLVRLSPSPAKSIPPPSKKEESNIKTIKFRSPVYAGNNVITYLEAGEKVRFVREKEEWSLIEFEEKGKKRLGWVKKDVLQ